MSKDLTISLGILKGNNRRISDLAEIEVAAVTCSNIGIQKIPVDCVGASNPLLSSNVF